jgi:predicted transcriptional regulator of viral defense system
MDVYTRLGSLGLNVFSLDDLLRVFPADRNTAKQQLHYWKNKGWIINLKRNIYELAYPGNAAKPDFYIANRLYEPSYISLETALSYYSLIPDVAMGVTSITTKPTREFRNHYGFFSYRSIVDRAYQGYTLINVRGMNVKIAEPEKAFVDYIHYNKNIDLDALRINKRKLKSLDKKKMVSYASVLNESLANTVRTAYADL